MHAELGADEADGAAEALDRRLGACAVLLQHALEAGDPLERRAMGCRDLRQVWRQVGQLSHRVSGVKLPGVRVEGAEELRSVRVPRPAVVERDSRERRELRRQPPRELGGALVRLLRSRHGRDVHDPRRAHGGST